MNITNEMLQAAMKKAVEAGLLPRNAYRENMQANQELIRFILEAALDVAPSGKKTGRRGRSDGAVTYQPVRGFGPQGSTTRAAIAGYSFR